MTLHISPDRSLIFEGLTIQNAEEHKRKGNIKIWENVSSTLYREVQYGYTDRYEWDMFKPFNEVGRLSILDLKSNTLTFYFNNYNKLKYPNSF